MPTVQSSCVAALIRSWICRANASGSSVSTARNASSQPITSVTAPRLRNAAITSSDTASYAARSAGRNTQSGQRRAAVRSGSPECTPKTRASYEAVATTPRLAGSPSPPTTTGSPRSSGRRSTSTAAMNWSRSTCSTQRVTALVLRPTGAAAPLGSPNMAGRGGTRATQLLASLGIAHTIHRYTHDPAASSYGLEASEALGVPPERVFKTLVADVDGALAVGVLPVHRQLDLKALAAAVGGKKAAMAEATAAERATGYVAGGISPIGQKRRLPIVVDSSALALGTMLCSAGRRGLEIEIAPADLIRAVQAKVAAIAALFHDREGSARV